MCRKKQLGKSLLVRVGYKRVSEGCGALDFMAFGIGGSP